MKTSALLFAPLLGVLAACATQPAPVPPIDGILAGSHRTPAWVERDRYRHPKETLEFFGLKPRDTVVEVWPGRGWYTEILAPYTRPARWFYAAGFSLSGADVPQYQRDIAAEFARKMSERPDLYGHVVINELGRPDRWQACPSGTADLVLTFRNVHNWIAGGYEADMFRAFHTALRPGGVLGVVEHRARPGTPREQMVKTGYVTEAYVIELAEQAGFKLDARSEVNANPRDTTDHPKGVWTLPPTLALKDVNRDQYLAIGESDRMTLRFVKPR